MIKKTLLLFILILLINLPVFSIENTNFDVVELEQDMSQTPDNIQENVQKLSDSQPKTLQEKLQDIYHLEVERIDVPTYLLTEILTKKFDEKSMLESIHYGCGYNADWNMSFIEDGTITNDYEFNAISPYFEGKFKNNTADFKIMTRFSPKSSMNWMQYLVSDAWVATNKIPHHRVQAGSFRPPMGVEGATNTYVLPFVTRSQISRTFGNARKFGARIQGNYSLVDYDIGGYSSDTFWQEFFPGTEFIGWINFKPLGLTNGKYGQLKLGGGIQTGHRNCNYTVVSTAVGYQYKKFNIDFEWENANGYNGSQMQSTDKEAYGFNTTLGYRITPKIQLVTRYDQFCPDKNVSNNKRHEYSVGLNYFIKGQGLKFMLNYVFFKNEATKNSHRILLGTQLLL